MCNNFSAKFGDYFRLLAPGTYELAVDAPGYQLQVQRITVTNQTLSTAADLVINFAMIPRKINEQAYLENLQMSRHELADDEQDGEPEENEPAPVQNPPLSASDYSDKYDAPQAVPDDGEDLQNILNLLRATPGRETVDSLAGAVDDRDVQDIMQMLKTNKAGGVKNLMDVLGAPKPAEHLPPLMKE